MIQKSRFISRCFPVESEREAAEQIERIRRSSFGANHNCYAFRIGLAQVQSRSSDDGEPSGTAGMPILNVLSTHRVTNVLCVVTRYFGGILLGMGGLVRAYSGGALRALEAAGIDEMRSGIVARIRVPYPLWQRTERYLGEHTTVLSTEYGEDVSVTFWTDEGEYRSNVDAMLQLSDGRLSVEKLGEEIRRKS